MSAKDEAKHRVQELKELVCRNVPVAVILAEIDVLAGDVEAIQELKHARRPKKLAPTGA